MKRTIHLTIDSDLAEAAKIRRFKQRDFSLSELVNDFLRNYFDEDLSHLEKDKLQLNKAELEKKLALIKSQIEAVNKENQRQEEKYWKKQGFSGVPVEVKPDGTKVSARITKNRK